ncbi:MAG TPA: hypothetical protein VMW15_15070 [Terracidiphilus sp.]|nr:hypothetical protein [Terracidiphilus sp.]
MPAIVRTKLGMIDATIHILKVEQDSVDGLLVTFTDGTVAGYVVEELLLLRPFRETAKDYSSHAALPAPPNLSTIVHVEQWQPERPSIRV